MKYSILGSLILFSCSFTPAGGRTMRYAIYWGDEDGLVGTTDLSLEDRIMDFLREEDFRES